MNRMPNTVWSLFLSNILCLCPIKSYSSVLRGPLSPTISSVYKQRKGIQVLYKLSSGALSSVLSPWLLGTLLVCEAEVCSCWAHDPSFWRSFCSQQHHPCWLSFTSAPADCIPRSLCQGLQPASSIGCSLPIFTEGSPCSWLAHQLSASALLNHATMFHNYSKVYILQFAVTHKISNYLNVYFYINI